MLSPRKILLALAFSSVVAAQQWPRIEDEHEQAERQRWFYDQRTSPNGIPAGARLRAIRRIEQLDAEARQRHLAAQRNGMLAVQNPGVTLDSANWTLIGPKPTVAGTTNITAGRVSAIAIDPRDNNTVYIGAAEGGVWKTTDGGANWTPLTDQQPSLATGAIAIDPVNPDTIYVGTGEENFSGDSYYGAGILKSFDGGATWTNIVGPFLRDMIGGIAIQPGNNNTLIVASEGGGLWRSTDAGATWTNTLSGASGTAVVFDPTNGSSAYAAVGAIRGATKNGIYHSTDGGRTWTLVNGSGTTALPAPLNMGRIDLAMAPSDPNTMYAQIQDGQTATFGALLGIYKTTDGGATWNQLPISKSQASLWSTNLWYYNTIRVSPTDPNVVWSGGIQIFRSIDGGATWVALAQTGTNGTPIHVDFHALEYTPDGSKLYLGNDGGMYSTTDVTATRVNWTNLNSTLAITEFYPGITSDPSNALSAVGGTQDNGTQRYDGGTSWSNVTCGDGGYATLDPLVPALMFAACQNIAVERTLAPASANTWVSATYGIDKTDSVQFIAPLVIDPGDPSALYFGTYRVWQSQDSAGRWNAVSPDLTLGKKGTIKSIAVAPSDSNTVYVVTSNSVAQVTHDMQNGAAATWTQRATGLPPRTPTKIVVDPVDPTIAYVTFSGFAGTSAFSGHVYETRNSGATWMDISGNLPDIPVNDLVVDPDLYRTIYIGTDAGVMVTTDAGATWSTLGNGLPRVVVDSLTLHRKSRVLRAGTHGRSVWDIYVPISGADMAPAVTTLTPTTVSVGDPGATVTLTGSNFITSTTVLWNGRPRPTTFVDATHVTVKVPASDLTNAGRAMVTALNAVQGGGTSNGLSFLIGSGPQSTAKSAVSAANPLGGNNLALRSIASIYGLNLSSGTAVADLAPPLPAQLGGTVVTMLSGTQTIPLFFVSPNQINFQVPFITTGTQSLTITQGSQSTTIPVTLVNYAPALFSTNNQGSGQAATIVANTSIVAAPVGTFPGSRPAKIGEYVSIYCTGLGDVTNRPSLGSASPGSPLASTLTTPTVTIGGVAAQVIFSGLAPGYVGLYQVNAKIPDTSATGAAVPIVLSVAGVTSNTVTIAVDPAQ